MNVLQTSTFAKHVKKLHSNQKKDLNEAIKKIIANPFIGEPKKGDLAGIHVYKFKMINQLTLLAYAFYDTDHELHLLALGTHENFYRNMKR